MSRNPIRPSTLLLAATALLLGSGLAFADRYVDSTGSDAANDCSLPGSPCASIAHAVSNATAGETVFVAPGTYFPAGTVVLDKENLTILGPQDGVDPRPVAGTSRTYGSAFEAVLDGSANSVGTFFRIAANGVAIRGLDLSGALDDFIQQTGDFSAAVVAYNIVRDGVPAPGGSGVHFAAGSSNTVEHNLIFSVSESGVLMSGSASSLIQNNEVGGTASPRAAIYSYNSTDIDVVGNTVYQSFLNDGITLGAAGLPNNGGRIENNSVTGTANDGIYSRGSVNLYIAGNTVFDVPGTGIYLFESADITVTANTLTGNTIGLELTNCADVTTISAEANSFFGNTTGIRVTGGSGTLNATNSDWGTELGPRDTTGSEDCLRPNEGGFNCDTCDSNPDGDGDPVSERVEYCPWVGTFDPFTPTPTPTDPSDPTHTPTEVPTETPTPDPGSAQVRYVAPGGSDGGNDCTLPGSPCLTIAYAVGQAQPGDTVQLAAGAYQPTATVTINKAGLTVRGAQAGVDPRSAAALRTAGSASESVVNGQPFLLGAVFSIAANNVTLDGLDVRGGSGDMVHQGGSFSGTTLRNLFVHDPRPTTGDEGIQLLNCDGCLIEYCHTFNTAGDGINFADSRNSTVRFNEVRSSWSSHGGIYLYSDLNMVVEGNLVTGNSAGSGINLGGGNASQQVRNAVLRDNEVRNNSGHGIRLRASSNNILLDNNRITNNTGSGVTISGGSTFRGFDNTISQNSIGLEIASVTDLNSVDFSGNEFTGNTSFGIRVTGGTGSIDATNCNWGTDFGPSDSTGTVECLDPTEGGFNTECDLNLLGAGSPGNVVSGAVRYSPWIGEFPTATPTPTATSPDDPTHTPTPTPTNTPTSTPTAAATRYVATTGSDAGNDCSAPGNPCQTVQHAVNVSFPGDTIQVAAGVYALSSAITVDKNNLSLRGAQYNVDPRPSQGSTRTNPAAETILDGLDSGIGTLVNIQANWVTLNGFTVRFGSGDMVTQPGSQSGTIISYNIVRDSTSPGDEGIQLHNADMALIYRNYALNTGGDGISYANSQNSRILENEVASCRSTNGGIYVYASTNIEVQGNLVRDTINGDGILIGATGQTVFNSRVLNNTVTSSAGAGVRVRGSGLIQVLNTTVSLNQTGFLFENSQPLQVAYNTVTQNTLGMGFNSISNLANVSCFRNVITDNGAGLVENGGTGTLIARFNSWGADSGPFDPIGSDDCPTPIDSTFNCGSCEWNPDGEGDSISDGVLYCPWVSSLGDCTVLGDFDGDGLLSANDALQTLRYGNRLISDNEITDGQRCRMDITQDGLVSAYDAYCILRTANNLPCLIP